MAKVTLIISLKTNNNNNINNNSYRSMTCGRHRRREMAFT